MSFQQQADIEERRWPFVNRVLNEIGERPGWHNAHSTPMSEYSLSMCISVAYRRLKLATTPARRFSSLKTLDTLCLELLWPDQLPAAERIWKVAKAVVASEVKITRQRGMGYEQQLFEAHVTDPSVPENCKVNQWFYDDPKTWDYQDVDLNSIDWTMWTNLDLAIPNDLNY